MQNNINVTYARYGHDFISAVANVQSAVKSLIMVQFNKTFFCFVANHMQNNINVTDVRYCQDLISAVANFQVHSHFSSILSEKICASAATFFHTHITFDITI